MLISLTVGKVDAGLAILLTEDKRLIEFPSILLPPGIASGSIVDIQVSRNISAESAAKDAFQALQDEIYNNYGRRSPSKPVLRVRNATQTSIVLEWDPIDLATSTLRSLTLYRNNSKAGAIPNPTSHTSTKISGLSVDSEYTFHLVLRTSAGTYSSEKVTIKTHKMTDLSGITVCPGIMPAETREALEAALQRIGAKPLQDSVRIDTTHFVCVDGRGPAWERAQEMNIPVVRPEWVEACEREGRIVGVRQFYLGQDMSKMRQGLPHRPSHPQRGSVSQGPESPVVSPRASTIPPNSDSEQGVGPAAEKVGTDELAENLTSKENGGSGSVSPGTPSGVDGAKEGAEQPYGAPGETEPEVAEAVEERVLPVIEPTGEPETPKNEEQFESVQL